MCRVDVEVGTCPSCVSARRAARARRYGGEVEVERTVETVLGVHRSCRSGSVRFEVQSLGSAQERAAGTLRFRVVAFVHDDRAGHTSRAALDTHDVDAVIEALDRVQRYLRSVRR